MRAADPEDDARDSRTAASLSTLTFQVGTLVDTVRDLQGSLAGNVSSMARASADQAAELSTLTAALRAAVAATTVDDLSGSPAGCSGRGCLPVIEAVGNNIAIRAPNGAVEISSDSCTAPSTPGVRYFSLISQLHGPRRRVPCMLYLPTF